MRIKGIILMMFLVAVTAMGQTTRSHVGSRTSASNTIKRTSKNTKQARTGVNRSISIDASPSDAVYVVSNAHEFIKALGSNRTIEINSETPIIITPEIRDMIESYALTQMTDADLRRQSFALRYHDNFDGPGLDIINCKNLVIKGVVKGAEIQSTPRYADVLSFHGCDNINLDNIIVGHTDEGYCDEGVLGFSSTDNVTITNCDFYGCGTVGFTINNCKNFDCIDSNIHHCSYDILEIRNSRFITFTNCKLYNNKEFEQIIVDGNSRYVTFNNCDIYNNVGPLFSLRSKITMNNCRIAHSGNLGDKGMVEDNNCTWQ